MATTLLQFGRMSFDGEITAMKASGLSLWQVIAPVVLLAILLSFVCIYVSGMLAPACQYAQRQLVVSLGLGEPVNLLEEGRFVRDFPGMMVYVSKKDRRAVQDVVVYEVGEQGVKRTVRAKSGTVAADKAHNLLLIDLYDVRIDQPDEKNPRDPTKTITITAKHYPVKLDFTELMGRQKLTKKRSDLPFPELMHAIRDTKSAYPHLEYEDLVKQRMVLVVEANKRLSLALSCFAFALLAVPLGMKSRRKESSLGIGMSLLLVFCFYFFIIVAESLVSRPAFRPDLIVWFPLLAAEAIGIWLIRRAE